MTGASDGYSYELQGSEVRITVRGLKEDLDSLSPDKMNLSLDGAGMTPGIHTAVLKYQLDEAYEMIGIPSVTVGSHREDGSFLGRHCIGNGR